MEELDRICFQLISCSGSAKSCYIEAIDAAEHKDFKKASDLIREGDEMFHEGHNVHFQLIQKDARNEEISMRILLIHAEDQLMAAETTKIMAEKFIHLYQIQDRVME